MKRAVCLLILLAGGCLPEDTNERYIDPWSRAAMEKDQRDNAHREAYLASHPESSEQVKTAIRAKHVWIGMSAEECIASIGEPTHINRTGTTSGVSEQWVYQRTYNSIPWLYVYFEDGKLTAWQD